MSKLFKKPAKNARTACSGALAVLLLTILDQLTKRLAVNGLMGQEDIRLIPGVLHLHYLENQSAAFSMDPVSLLHRIFHFRYFTENPDAFLHAKMLFFTIITVIVILAMILLYLRIPYGKRYLAMDIILIAFTAGAIGNLIDRMAQQYVVDFIYFCLIDFPVFNVADIYVTCAAFAFVFFSIFVYDEHDFEVIL